MTQMWIKFMSKYIVVIFLGICCRAWKNQESEFTLAVKLVRNNVGVVDVSWQK